MMARNFATSAKGAMTYEAAGVDTRKAEGALHGVKEIIRRTFSLAGSGGRPVLDLGYFANVLDLDGHTGLAISTDGVGSKVLIAQRMRKYDTIGIDCVAMNVNDLLCVGARPTSLVDYVAVEQLNPAVMLQVIEGLYEGARQACVSIPGGEISQMADCIFGDHEGSGLDLVGTAVGLVALDKILIGQNLAEGDVLIGLASSGLHSNGFTLARKVIFDILGWDIDKEVAELGCTIGEELLRPTRIYVAPIVEMLQTPLCIKALMHITGDGFFNLLRTEKPAGFVIDRLPEPLPIFSLLQQAGQISDAEMYRVFNMGVGLCVVVDPAQADAVTSIAAKHGVKSSVLGAVRLAEEHVGRVRVVPLGLVGEAASGQFQPA